MLTGLRSILRAKLTRTTAAIVCLLVRATRAGLLSSSGATSTALILRWLVTGRTCRQSWLIVWCMTLRIALTMCRLLSCTVALKRRSTFTAPRTTVISLMVLTVGPLGLVRSSSQHRALGLHGSLVVSLMSCFRCSLLLTVLKNLAS